MWPSHRYKQEDAVNTASELVFDEFEEVIARIFHQGVWPSCPAETAEEAAAYAWEDEETMEELGALVGLDLDSLHAEVVQAEADRLEAERAAREASEGGEGSGGGEGGGDAAPTPPADEIGDSISISDMTEVLGRHVGEGAAARLAAYLLASDGGSGRASRAAVDVAFRRLGEERAARMEVAEAQKGGELERAMSRWLGETFVPTAQASIKTKKLKAAPAAAAKK